MLSNSDRKHSATSLTGPPSEDISEERRLHTLIKQPTLSVGRKDEKREEGYKGLHSGLTIAGLTIYYA